MQQVAPFIQKGYIQHLEQKRQLREGEAYQLNGEFVETIFELFFGETESKSLNHYFRSIVSPKTSLK